MKTWNTAVQQGIFGGKSYRRIIPRTLIETPDGRDLDVATPWVDVCPGVPSLISLFRNDLRSYNLLCSHCRIAGHFSIYSNRIACRLCGKTYNLTIRSPWFVYLLDLNPRHVADIEMWESVWDGI